MENLVTLHKYKEELIFNYDETMVEYMEKVNVIVPIEQTPAKENLMANSIHITLGIFISGDGGYLKPMLVLPLKEFPVNVLDQVKDFVWSG